MRRAKDESLREFASEERAREFILELAAQYFDIFPEVKARSLATNDSFRLDAVSVCEGTGYILGWEFKRSHLFKSEFAAALKQAADYRDAVIDDPNLPGLSGKRVQACLVFPDWCGLHDNGEVLYRGEADGMRLMASHFRVGTFSHFGYQKQHHIIIGEQAIWHSGSGWTGNAEGVLMGKRRRGSQRRVD